MTVVPASATVRIGTVGRPHGTGGAVKARPIGATLGALPRGTTVLLESSDGARSEAVIESVATTGSHPIMRFRGFVSREAAAAVTGCAILIPEASLPRLGGADEFYVRDLIGCEVECAGRRVGVVTDVLPLPGNDVLEVDRGGELLLIPFTRDAVPSVDLTRRRIVAEESRISGDLGPIPEGPS